MFLISLFLCVHLIIMLAVIIVYIFQCIHISYESIVVSNNNNNNLLHVNSIGNRIADRQMHIYMNCELQYHQFTTN